MCCFHPVRTLCVCIHLTLVTCQREERVFKSKFVFKDISGISFKRTPAVIVDYSGVTRQLTDTETSYRSWTSKYYVVKRADIAGVRPSSAVHGAPPA